MKKQDEIEELFSSSFDGFEKIPPIDVKGSIDDLLFNKNEGFLKRRRGFFWILSSVVVILLGGTFIFFSEIEENERGLFSKQENSSDALKVKNSKIIIKDENQPEIDQVKFSVNKKELNELSSEKEVFQKLNDRSDLSSLSSNNTNSKTKKYSKTNDPKSMNQEEISRNTDKERTGNRLDDNKPIILPENNSVDDTVFDDLIAFGDGGSKINVTDSIKVEDPKSKEIDSTINSNPIAYQNPTLPTIPPKGHVDSTTFSPWTLSIYAAGTHGFSSLKNSTNENYSMTERTGFSSSLEMNYSFSPKFSFSSGLDYNGRIDVFTKITPSGDSVLTGYSMQFVYQNPANQDSIIDTIYVANYSVYPTETEQNQMIQHSSFAIPVYFGWNIFAQGNWRMTLSTGLRFSYTRNKVLSDELPLNPPQFKSFGLRASFRPEIVYSFNKFGLGVYLTTGFDLIPTIQWNSINRQRFDLGAGVVLKYHL